MHVLLRLHDANLKPQNNYAKRNYFLHLASQFPIPACRSFFDLIINTNNPCRVLEISLTSSLFKSEKVKMISVCDSVGAVLINART